ncbi:MAG TPA: hypothetical protein VKP67_07430 [Xanthobacteraceae bacterium]|nr:hypothetical protein [Xanthobacteraceae bacterium]
MDHRTNFIVAQTAKPVAAIAAGAVSATVLNAHPHIWHIESQHTVALYSNIGTATVTSSVSASTAVST